MKSSRSTLCSEHRLARLIAWTRLVLVWIAALFFDDAFEPSARQLDRYGFISLQTLKRRVRNLIIIRAAQGLGPGRKGVVRRNFTPPGFRRRLPSRPRLRSIAGSRLRRALRGRNALEAISAMLVALRDIDKLAQSIARGLSRLAPVLIVRPPHDAARTLAQPQVCTVDSS